MEYRIGFKGKYYKLYEYTVTYEDYNGKTYKIEYYRLIKPISMSKEKTIKKYPDVEFDDRLNNLKHSTLYIKTQIIYKDKFHCGKYAGKYFEMCDDYDYLNWYFNTCATEEQKNIIEPILSKEGYELIEKEYCEGGSVNDPNNIIIKQEMISPEKQKEIENNENIKTMTLEKLNKKLPFIVNFERNINSDGCYFDKNLQINLKFDRYKVSYWDDIVYGMPLWKNGKGRRIKGKQIMITDYIVNIDYVTILDWRFA